MGEQAAVQQLPRPGPTPHTPLVHSSPSVQIWPAASRATQVPSGPGFAQ
jgi:hypothetical protein